MSRVLATLLLTFAACATPRPPWHPPAPLAPPAIDDSVWIIDEDAGREVDLDAMVGRLAQEEVVFFGETHLDENTHRLELAVYEGLIARTGGKVVLAMEMFERDVQPALDDYLAGRIDEQEFMVKARVWSNYRTGYRALIEEAKRRGLPVVASNAPRSMLRKVGMGGREAFDALPPEERALLPDELLPTGEAYWERVARAVRGHAMGGTDPDARLTSAQSLWDNTMGDSCAKALARWPGWVVLHVNGGFHSQYRDGTVHQLLARRPETRVAVLEAVPVDEFRGFDPFGNANRADYLAYVRRRASGLSEGFEAVIVAPELRFRLHVPPRADDAHPVPLLVWLPDDGFRAADGLSLWAAALGNEAALAVVEAPYPVVGDDQVQGGRWFWPETFDHDLGVLGGALPEIVAYVTRYYPVDRARVVIAGAGTGATVVAATALYAGDPGLAWIAAAPRRHGKLRMLGLPGPAERDGLRVLVPEEDRGWWEKEAEDYGSVGLTVAVEPAPANAWERLRATEDAVRMALGAPSRPAVAGEPTVLVLETDTPRARDWAYRYALRLDGPVTVAGPEEGAEGTVLGFGEGKRFSPEDLADGRCLPLAAGPFGGTTILVVPAGTPEAEHAAWKSLGDQDVIKKRSRFARLVVLFEDEQGTGLPAALEEIHAAGRRAVLVVPAAFCVDDATMRRWRAEAAPWEDRLDLAWLPGLGGGLYRLAEKTP